MSEVKPTLSRKRYEQITNRLMELQDQVTAPMPHSTPICRLCNAEGYLERLSGGVHVLRFDHEDWCAAYNLRKEFEVIRDSLYARTETGCNRDLPYEKCEDEE